MIEFGHGTHPGLRQSFNADTYFADATRGLFLVVDGIGEPGCGDYAAALTRDHVVAAIDHGHTLIQAIAEANAAVGEATVRQSQLAPMGATVAAMTLHGGGFHAAWVGDTRIYRCSDVLDPIVAPPRTDTADAPAGGHDLRTQALGITASGSLKVGTVTGTLPEHASVLLCSDGLVERLPDATLLRLLQRRDITPQECVDQLLLAALEAGCEDNLTAIVIHCDGLNQAPREPVDPT